jgi:hypothetical protein
VHVNEDWFHGARMPENASIQGSNARQLVEGRAVSYACFIVMEVKEHPRNLQRRYRAATVDKT